MASGSGRGCKRNRDWHEAGRQEHVEAWAESGLSVVEYSRRHGLHPRSLYRWRRFFAAVGRGGEDGARAAGGLFAEVRVTAPAPSSPDSGVEVALPGGRVVRVCAGFDAGTLACVVRVLEGL